MSTVACGNSPASNSWANYTVDGTPSTGDNGKNRIKGSSNGIYQYDGATSGNVFNDGRNQYLYDAEGRICAVKGILTGSMTGYLYDADGIRIAKGAITTWTCDPNSSGLMTAYNETEYILGAGGEQVTEMSKGINGSMKWEHTNVFAGGKLLATYVVLGLHFYLDDALGSRRVQTNYAGVVEQTCASLPFGDQLSCRWPNSDPPQ